VSRRGRTARLLAGAVAPFAILLAVALPAGAHGSVGTLGIEVTPGAAPLTATVRVLLEYANDREVAPGATVVAEAIGPDGATVGPTPLADRGQGSYEAVLTMPAAGPWTVTVTASDPAATASGSVTVSATPTATTAPDADVRISADQATRERRPSDDGGPSPALLAAVAVVLVAAAGVTFVLVRRR